MENIPVKYLDADFCNLELTGENKQKVETIRHLVPGHNLVIMGGTGVGKTHMAVAVMRNMYNIPVTKEQADYEKNKCERRIKYSLDEEVRKNAQRFIDNEAYLVRPANCYFFRAVELISILNRETKNNTKDIYLKSLNKYDCILIDDFAAERTTDAVRQNYFDLIDQRILSNKSIVITTNLNYGEFNKFDPRIRSRLFEKGFYVAFEGEDYRMKDAANKIIRFEQEQEKKYH